jgi:hypothetical protein
MHPSMNLESTCSPVELDPLLQEESLTELVGGLRLSSLIQQIVQLMPREVSTAHSHTTEGSSENNYCRALRPLQVRE